MGGRDRRWGQAPPSTLLYYLLSDGHPVSPPHSGTRFSHPQLSTLLPLLSPYFLCKKVRRPILLTIDSMQLAVTLHGSETIVSR